MERRLWTSQEDQIIISLVNHHGKKKWTLIADQMQKITPKNCRTSKQIRERWHNHLDPEVNKEPWTPEEEIILFDAHRKYGSKWKQIASILERRTDNYVKNHFYSTLRRSLRRINKYLGSKNSTNQMRTIKPSILSYLLDLSDVDRECRILVSRIFQFANFKPSKNSKTQLKDLDKNKFQQAITKLLQINDQYTQEKNKKKGKQSFKHKTPILFKEEYSSDKVQLSTLKNAEEISERSDEEKLCIEVESWNQESPMNVHYQMLPEIQVPQYQCELLSEKLQYNFDMQDQTPKTMETVNLYVP